MERALPLLFAFEALGCAGTDLHATAATELRCPREHVQITEIGASRAYADGCRRHAEYRYESGEQRWRVVKASAPIASEPGPAKKPYSPALAVVGVGVVALGVGAFVGSGMLLSEKAQCVGFLSTPLVCSPPHAAAGYALLISGVVTVPLGLALTLIGAREVP